MWKMAPSAFITQSSTRPSRSLANAYISSFGIAPIYDALGDKERGLAAFERAYQDRAVEFEQMKQYPLFKTIVSDSRFQAAVNTIGLPR